MENPLFSRYKSEFFFRNSARHPEYSNDSYVSNNLALMHIYFKKLHFIRHERGEFYGFVDFFSNIGGLLGLCLVRRRRDLDHLEFWRLIIVRFSRL